MDAVPEIVLQRYILDKFPQFQSYFQKYYNAKISYVRSNQPEDKFPDLYFVLEDKREIPDEVIYRIAELKGTSKEKLEMLREEKASKRGKFSDNLFLVDTTDG